MNARELFDLLESRLRGEYWIHPDGNIEYADGDVGDINHEGIIIQTCCGLLAGDLGLWKEEPEWDDIEEAAEEQGRSLEEVARSADPRVPAQLLLNAARGNGDVRTLAMQYWGYKWMRGSNVTSWTLTPEDLRAISKGVDEAAGQEGFQDDEDGGEGGLTVTVRDSRGHSFEANTNDLREGRLGPRNVSTWDNDKTGAEQTRKIDQQGTPSFYKGHLGDSLIQEDISLRRSRVKRCLATIIRLPNYLRGLRGKDNARVPLTRFERCAQELSAKLDAFRNQPQQNFDARLREFARYTVEYYQWANAYLTARKVRMKDLLVWRQFEADVNSVLGMVSESKPPLPREP